MAESPIDFDCTFEYQKKLNVLAFRVLLSVFFFVLQKTVF